MIRSVRYLLIALLLFALGPAALAQSVPDNIPVDPEESPADRQRKRLEERYRPTLSRLFASSEVAVAPSFSQQSALYEFTARGGVDLPNGDALHLALGTRSYPVAIATDEPFAAPDRKTAYLFSMGYDLRLTRILPFTPITQRSMLGISVGGVFDEIGVVAVEVGPKYILPINRYWSIPLGLKVSTAVLGDREASLATTFIGASIGVKRHFGQRDRLD